MDKTILPLLLSLSLTSTLLLTPTHSLSMSSTTTTTPPIESPYGSWISPISSSTLTTSRVSLSSLRTHSGSLYWIEGRPWDDGRYVLCRYDPNSPQKTERDGVDVTPIGSNCRTRVHEYGGGAVTFGGGGGGETTTTGDDTTTIYYSEFSTQQLMTLTMTKGYHGEGKDDDTTPLELTPNDNRYRFADGHHVDGNNNNNIIAFVREDHENPSPADVRNEIVIFDATTKTFTVVASGNDFYASPRVSPDGTSLAYVTWNHPNMPWDATELRVMNLDTREEEVIAGGIEGSDASVLQPSWHPVTGELYYISDETGYYNIHRRGGKSESPVISMPFDFGGSSPGWVLGQQGFTFLTDGRLVATYDKEGSTRLLVANASGTDDAATDVREYGSDDGLPMQFGGVVAMENTDDLYFIGGDPRTPPSIYRYTLGGDTAAAAVVLARSCPLSIPSSVISTPTRISFPSTAGTAYGYHYPPRNDAYRGTSDTLPPLLVKAHGGPTSCASKMFNPHIQYWTSRGFAVLDVDYSGSTGYGREYRRRLKKSWGVLDVDDVCNGAMFLAENALVDGSRLCIDGGSAGGYTTLAALAFKNVFHAGCSLYGIGDLEALAGDTHKFESRYLDGLVGAYPQETELYRRRSPIRHVDGLSCPILLLQGEEDKIVPPNQARMMYDAVKGKGLACCLKIYEGEQHGFRKAENIQDAIESELAFYGKVFGIAVPNAVPLDIDNMD